jgi:hypothetical protein
MNRIIATVCLLASLMARDATATVFAPREFSELVRAARAIVYGQVVSIRARESGDRLRVETLVTLRVGSYLKGNLGEEVTFVVPGGTFGRYRTVIVGAPQFREGEEVVLFLNTRGPSMPYVLRMGEGVFRVVRQPDSTERTVLPAPLIGQSAAWQPIVRGDSSRPLMSLGDFAAQVRRLAEGTR